MHLFIGRFDLAHRLSYAHLFVLQSIALFPIIPCGTIDSILDSR